MIDEFKGHTVEEVKEFRDWNKEQRKVTKKVVLTDDQKLKMKERTRAYMQKLRLCDPLEYKAQWKYKNLLNKFKDDSEGLSLELRVYLRVVKKMRKHFLRRGIEIDA